MEQRPHLEGRRRCCRACSVQQLGYPGYALGVHGEEHNTAEHQHHEAGLQQQPPAPGRAPGLPLCWGGRRAWGQQRCQIVRPLTPSTLDS